MELKTVDKAFIPCRGGLVAYMGDRVCVENTHADGGIERYTGRIIAISDTSDMLLLHH